jgi:HPt (histidine-containing phosphotransfer) domain-containing protein
LEGDGFQHKLRAHFAKAGRNAVKDIRSAITNRDMVLAHRLAHTLKGNAGQIHERELQSIAAHAEGLLKEGKPVSDGLMESLEYTLKEVLERCAAYLQEEKTESAQTHKISNKKALEILKRLEPFLISRNTDSQNMLDEVRMVPGAETLAAQIEDFDFKDALDTLKGLKEKLI